MRRTPTKTTLALVMGLGLVASGAAWAEAPAEELPPCPLACAPGDDCPEHDPQPDPERCTLPTSGPARLTLRGPSVFPAGVAFAGDDPQQLIVDPRGFLTFDSPWDGAGPMPLAQTQRPLIAAFWADLQVGPCPDPDEDGPREAEEQGQIIRERVEQGVRIVWRDMPLSLCPTAGPRATFSVELNTDEAGRLRRAWLSYPDLPESLAVEPRAGLNLPATKLELLPDIEGEVTRDRAKRLAGYGTERSVVDGQPVGPIIVGEWLVEVNPDGELLGDPDNDGVRSADNCGVPNPWQWNSDGDAFGDACDADDDNDDRLDLLDNCPQTFNPDQEDQDGDGLGDHCVDSDGDLLVDAIDRCPHDADPLEADRDDDGVPDACDADIDDDDIIAGGSNPWSTWWVPGEDNCPYLPTINRRDRDKDGVGDACDLRPYSACSGFACLMDADSDGDGFANLIDVCPLVPDPMQIDGDGDGIGDACEWDVDDDGAPDQYDAEDFACDPAICGPR